MKNKNFKFSNTGNAFLVAFVTFYVLSLAYELIFRFTGMTAAAQWCQYLLNPVAFIGSMLVYAKRKNVDVVSATRLNNKIGLKQAGILALLSISCIMAFLPVSNIFLDVLSRLGFDMSLDIVDTTENVGAYFAGLLLLAVLPAISEEFLMRGVVLNAASRKRDYSYAILITAGMFSLMHGNPIQTVHQFFLGMVLAYVVLVSRSLWAGILLHFFNNFLSLTLEFPYEALMLNTKLGTMPVGYWYLIWIVAILLGGTLVVYLLKKFTKISAPKRIEIVAPESEIIDVYENKDGVYSTEKTLKTKAKEQKNDFVCAFKDMCAIFKKGGLKSAYNKINTIIRDLTPEDDGMEEMTREDFFPSNVKLVYVILIVLWLLSLVTGFLG